MARIFYLPIIAAVFLSTTLAMDLTGDWKASTGENIYIRQVNNTIWYYGESGATGNWTSVGYGTLKGNTINLSWADVPKGKASLMGTVTLSITSDNKLQVIDQTGGWGSKGLTLTQFSSGF